MLRNAIKDASDIQLKRRASELLTRNVCTCTCTPCENYYAKWLRTLVKDLKFFAVIHLLQITNVNTRPAHE